MSLVLETKKGYGYEFLSRVGGAKEQEPPGSMPFSILGVSHLEDEKSLLGRIASNVCMYMPDQAIHQMKELYPKRSQRCRRWLELFGCL